MADTRFSVIKAMAFREPELLHKLLDHFAESIAAYLRYQIDSGAQVVQMFDSWAGQLSPADYDTFAAPYQKKVVDLVKQTHPDTPSSLRRPSSVDSPPRRRPLKSMTECLMYQRGEEAFTLIV